MAELVVTQVQFLQAGETTQTGGQALQMVVGHILKTITTDRTPTSANHTKW